MKKILFLFWGFFLIECIGARNSYEVPCFKSIKLYCYFEEGRGSRFPFSQYAQLERSNTSKINLTQEEVNMLNTIILNAKCTKGNIVKAGMKYLYMQGDKPDNNFICLVLLNAYTLFDASNGIIFEIENKDSIEWLKNFRDKYFNAQPDKGD